MRNDAFKYIKRIICMILIVCCIANVLQTSVIADDADEEEPKEIYEFLEDLKVYEGVSYEEAKRLSENDGYKLLDKDLNSGNKGGVYLAYKTTDDESKGITEITMLEMNVDYQMSNFQTIINAKVRELYPKAQMLQRAAEDFAAKYSQGSYDARYAYRLLDLLYIDELGMTLADAIVKGLTDADLFNRILVRATAGFTSAVTHALTIGISDPEDDNWATRIQNAVTKTLDAGKDNKTEYDDKYLQLADDAVRTVQSFATNYRKAQARQFYNDGILLNEEEYKDCDSAGDVVDILCDDTKAINTNDADIFYLSTYEILNRYDYDEDTKLGDFIVWAGEQTYNDMSDLRRLYPLIESMSHTQAEMLSVSDITLYVLYLQNNESVLNTDDASYNELKKLIKEYNKEARDYVKLSDDYNETVSKKNDSISIWAGVNQSIYDEEVAITDDAIRYNTAGLNYSEFTKDTSLSAFLDKIEVYFNIIQYSAGILTGVAHVVAMFTGYFSLYSAAMAAFTLGGAYAILGVLAMTFFIIEVIAIVALVVWLVVEFISWVWPEDEEDDVGEYTEIPNKAFDIKDISYDGEVHTSYVMYEAVKNQKGKCADLNNDRGKRWNALYYSNSPRVGNAIRVSELEDMFIVQYDAYSQVDGYTSVTSLGTHDIANINANTNKKPVYLLYRNRKNINQTSNNTGVQETEKEEEVMYLETIKLYSEKNETSAKALYKKEVNKGYVLIDLNMASGADKKYTYLAYKLTKNKEDALTDIRVCNAYAPDENTGATLQIGSSTYGLAGNLYNGSSLWITSSKSAGTPIIGAPEFVTDMEKAKEGWEPVNLASGGLAFDFNQGQFADTQYVKKEKNFNKHIYLYFNPSVKYTSGTEYLGGIAFFEMDKRYSLDKYLNSYLNDTGYTLFNKTDFGCLDHTFYSSPDEPYAGEDSVGIFLGYTTTYNPYRAIYDIGFYEGTTTTVSLNPFITTIEDNKSVAYNSVAMYMSGYGKTCMWLDYPGASTGYVRSMNTNNAYLSATLGNVNAIARCPVWTKDPKYSFDLYHMIPKGLYVKNHTGEYDSNGQLVPVENEKEKPLVVDDIYLSDKKSSINGYYPVKNMLNRYDRTEINLAAYSEINDFKFKKTIKNRYLDADDNLYYAYLYIRKDYEEKPRYISAVSVVSFEMPELKGDKDTKKATEKAYKNAADDSCRCNVLSSINAEMIDINVALNAKDRWTARKETYKTTLRQVEDNYDVAKRNAVGQASYIGVSRTNNASEAIRGMIKYKPKDKAEMNNPPSVITIGKAKYTCAGSKITGVDGDYYIYYTTNKGVSPCEPITDIIVDNEILISNATTAMTYTAQDTAESISTVNANVSDYMYYHCAYDTSNANAYSKLFIGVGNSANDAKADLLRQGCFTYNSLDLNKSAGGKYIYLGFEKYFVENIQRESYKTQAKYDRAYKNEYTDAIKDIIITVGEPYQDKMTYNNVVYYPVSKVNLNDGTNHGKEIYMYYTRDMSIDKNLIISAIGMAQFDRTPANTDDYRWERMLTSNGKKANLNDGCVSFSGDYIKENSLHMFMHRYGNVIKPGSEITGGYTDESQKYGRMYVGG